MRRGRPLPHAPTSRIATRAAAATTHVYCISATPSPQQTWQAAVRDHVSTGVEAKQNVVLRRREWDGRGYDMDGAETNGVTPGQVGGLRRTETCVERVLAVFGEIAGLKWHQAPKSRPVQHIHDVLWGLRASAQRLLVHYRPRFGPQAPQFATTHNHRPY